jgi:hypothetical protein
MSFKSFQCLLKSSLIVEYSRMKVPSLSSGCEIAQFLFAIPPFGRCALPKSLPWGGCMPISNEEFGKATNIIWHVAVAKN